MALPRNINIQQDPLEQALDMFQQVFHGAVNRTIEQRGITERRNAEIRDMRVVQAMDKILGRVDTVDSKQLEGLIQDFGELRKAGSPMVNNLIGGTIEDWMKDSLIAKRESEAITDRTNVTLNEIKSKWEAATKAGNLDSMKNVTNMLLSTEKSLLDKVGADFAASSNPALKKALQGIKDFHTIQKATIGLYEYDDPEIEGFQFKTGDEAPGDYVKEALEGIKTILPTDPETALKRVQNLDRDRARDVTARKAYDKAFVKYKQDLATDAEKEALRTHKDAVSSYGKGINSRAKVFNNLLKNSGIPTSKVQQFVSKVDETGRTDEENIGVMKKQAANTIFQLQKKMSDDSIPFEAKKLFTNIEYYNKVGNTDLVIVAESKLEEAKKTGNEEVIAMWQEKLDEAKVTTTKDIVDAKKDELANWWLNHSNAVFTLDAEKTFEFINDYKERNRIDSMSSMIDLYGHLRKGAPVFQSTLNKETSENIDASGLSQASLDALGNQ